CTSRATSCASFGRDSLASAASTEPPMSTNADAANIHPPMIDFISVVRNCRVGNAHQNLHVCNQAFAVSSKPPKHRASRTTRILANSATTSSRFGWALPTLLSRRQRRGAETLDQLAGRQFEQPHGAVEAGRRHALGVGGEGRAVHGAFLFGVRAH